MNVPPMMPDQKVYRSFGLNEKSRTFSRPIAPATRSESPKETSGGRRETAITNATAMPDRMTIICWKCVHWIAFTPPDAA